MIFTGAAVVAGVAGVAAGELNVPSAPLFAALLAGMAIAATGVVTTNRPKAWSRGAQAVTGLMIGGTVSGAALQRIGWLGVPFLGATLVTFALSGVAAWVLRRCTRLDFPTALLGVAPGGAAAMVACADDSAADARLVAVMQYIRLALTVVTAPLLLGSTGGHTTGGDTQWRLVSSGDQAAGLVVLGTLAAYGVLVAVATSLPSPWLIGPMLVSGTAIATGTVPGIAPTGLLTTCALVALGLDVGSRFTPAVLRCAVRLVVPILIGVIGLGLACGALAWLLSALLGVPLADAYLATTPGGINVVTAVAASTPHADVPLISFTQSSRLFLLVLLMAVVQRWLAARRKRSSKKSRQPVDPGVARSTP